jgi:hypothetical protein
MEIEKEKKVFKILFEQVPLKEFLFAEDLKSATILANKVFASRQIILIEEIELCG